MPAPFRTVSGYRLYSADDVTQVEFIRRARGLGLSSGEIIVTIVLLFALTMSFTWAQGPTAHVTLDVQGMVCPLCQATVERTLKGVPGVIEAKASYVTGKAEVDYDPNEARSEMATIKTLR